MDNQITKENENTETLNEKKFILYQFLYQYIICSIKFWRY